MITERQREQVLSHFRLAAQDFGFVFHAPFMINDDLCAFGHITDYGSANGTVICLFSPPHFTDENSGRILAWCHENGFYCSFLNVERFAGEYDRSCFREMLRDWGRFKAACPESASSDHAD